MCLFFFIRYNVLPESNPTALAAFGYADSDNDGVIDKAELEAAAERFDPDITEVEIEDILDEADENGDGVIDLQEFRVAFRAEEPQPINPPVTAPTPLPVSEAQPQPTEPPVKRSKSKSDKGNPCAKIKGKKARRKCLKKPWNY